MTKIKVALVAEGCLEEIVVCTSRKEAESYCDGYSKGADHYGGSGSAYTIETAQEYLKEMLEDINSGSTYYSTGDVKEFTEIIKKLKSK